MVDMYTNISMQRAKKKEGERKKNFIRTQLVS